MKKIVLILFMGLMPLASMAAELPSKTARIIKEEGIPLYGNMKYTNGSLKAGVRFASQDAVDKVRKFYQDALPGWTLINEHGSWILYNGKPEGGTAPFMMAKQVIVQENRKLPEWFSLPKDMTTEIVIVILDSH